MKKTLFLPIILLTLARSGDADAQLVTYDFEGETAAPTSLDGNVSAGNFETHSGNAVSFPAGSGSTDSISGSAWTGTGADNGKYWQFSVPANVRISLDLASLIFDSRSTGSGPANWEMTINSLPAGAGSIQNDSSFHPISASLNSFSALSSATVRISVFAASASGGTWAIDNVVLNGLALPPFPNHQHGCCS